MMRAIALALAVSAVLGFNTPALAMDATAPEAQELMKDYFGNTRICRVVLYFECHGWYNPDGTYVLFWYNSDKMTKETGDPRVGFNVVRGKWKIEGAKGDYRLCRTAEDAKQPAGPDCGLPEPERPDLTGPDRQHLGDIYRKYHDEGTLKGTTEYYYMVKGHV